MSGSPDCSSTTVARCCWKFPCTTIWRVTTTGPVPNVRPKHVRQIVRYRLKNTRARFVEICAGYVMYVLLCFGQKLLPPPVLYRLNIFTPEHSKKYLKLYRKTSRIFTFLTYGSEINSNFLYEYEYKLLRRIMDHSRLFEILKSKKNTKEKTLFCRLNMFRQTLLYIYTFLRSFRTIVF